VVFLNFRRSVKSMSTHELDLAKVRGILCRIGPVQTVEERMKIRVDK
jgi:hypothetical protein